MLHSGALRERLQNGPFPVTKMRFFVLFVLLQAPFHLLQPCNHRSFSCSDLLTTTRFGFGLDMRVARSRNRRRDMPRKPRRLLASERGHKRNQPSNSREVR